MALIYIVEDDPSIREIETIALKNSNYEVQTFSRASEFYKQLDSTVPDLALLDIMLPDEDGLSIVHKLRNDARTRRLPIILITAKTTEMDLVRGLDEGADDYIRKPFSIMELLSRVRAILRRFEEDTQKILSIGGIRMDHEQHLVTANGLPVELTFREYELLRFLMQNENVVLSRDVLMQSVWGTDYVGETRTVDMHIKTLRQKLGSAGSAISTVRNVGYVIRSTN